jgi:myosin-5
LLQAAILYNLKQRHLDNFPYTRTGDIIIAVNPFQWFTEIYTEKVRAAYANTLVWEDHEGDARKLVAPHVYEVSALCYKGLAFEGFDQSVLVSGESGAGKTETVKIAMNHIASVQRGKTTAADDGVFSDPVVNRVLESNPLLEAFGNAKTRRNDNSSRFGKYTQLQFDQGDKALRQFADKSQIKCKLAGSKCDVYLLEKNRVTLHDPEERTYHIFYQIIAATDAEKCAFWSGMKGTDNNSFANIGPTNTDTIEGMKDGDHFKETVKTLAKVNVTGDSLAALMGAICIVLQLGNLTFMKDPKDDDRSVVKDKSQFDALAELMGVTNQDLIDCLTERTMKTRNESYKVPLNADVSKESAAAFAGEIYAKCFLWLVRAINDATCAEMNYDGGGQSGFGIIGLLDIFGFESFVRNRFEQLCINYCNEKLQAKFTEDIFRSVQLEYEFEGIPLDEIKYDDNTDVLSLIEGKTGLNAMLNEECVRPKGSDEAFVQKALAANKNSPCLIISKTNRKEFGIHHFAGKVMYDSDGFVSSNQDTLPTDLGDCALKCSNEIISKHLNNEKCNNLETSAAATGKKSAPKRAKSNLVAPTVWTKYKGQLSKLMAMLKVTNSRYIRCIKPNTLKVPSVMEHVSAIEQLRCAGVVAAVTLSRSAFPNRMDNKVVRFKFSAMWDRTKYPSQVTSGMDEEQILSRDSDALLSCALKCMETEEKGKVVKMYVTGKTRSYFRMGALEYLEGNRTQEMGSQALSLQRYIRGWLIRRGTQAAGAKRKKDAAKIQKWYKECKKIIKMNEAGTQAREEMKKKKALEKKARDKAEKKAAAARELRLEKEKVERDAREAKEKEVREEREKKEKDAAAKREKKEKEAKEKFDKDKDKKLKKSKKEVKAKEKDLDDKEKKWEAEIAEVEQELEKAEQDRDEVVEQIQKEEAKIASMPTLSDKEKKKLEGSSEIISYLRKENKKLRGSTTTMRKDFDTMQENNKRLLEANAYAGASFEALNEQSKKNNSNNSKLMQNVDKYKKQNQKLKDDLRMRQGYYDAEAQIRVNYQKSMASIMEMIQDQCDDAQLTEDILVLALECESEAKSELAAAEAANPGA